MSVLSLLWTDAATVSPWQEGTDPPTAALFAVGLPIRSHQDYQPSEGFRPRMRGNQSTMSGSSSTPASGSPGSSPAPASGSPTPHSGRLRPTLSSDGESHKLLNTASVLVLIVGLVSFALAIVIRNDSAARGVGWAAADASTGLVSMVAGLGCQMVSTTTEQRILIVTGIIAGFVGFALGIAHGGFG